MLENLKKLEKHINSELSSKIHNSVINNDELLIEVGENDLIEVVQFIKSNEKLKFRQLIDIAGVDYPEEEKRFNLIYLFLSHENNSRLKLIVKFETSQTINSISKISLLLRGKSKSSKRRPPVSVLLENMFFFAPSGSICVRVTVRPAT